MHEIFREYKTDSNKNKNLYPFIQKIGKTFWMWQELRFFLRNGQDLDGQEIYEFYLFIVLPHYVP